MIKRDITLSLFKGIGIGACRNSITIEGHYKFITRNYVILFILITDTRNYYL